MSNQNIQAIIENAKAPNLKHQLQNPENFDFIMDTMLEVMENKIKYESKTIFTNGLITRNYLLANFRIRKHENFACLFLDNKHQLIKYEELFNGTVNESRVYPRVVAHKALELNACAVIFAHNHPSGNIELSQPDKRIADRLIEVLQLIDVRVLNHVIIGRSKIYSMAEHGLIVN